ncbi:hypothetical protein V3C99_000865 [Haemonchus contortus]
MTSNSLFVFLIVIVVGNIIATATSRTSTEQFRKTKGLNKCEDRPECPVHIANGFCYREGVTYEQRKTYCPRGCNLCDE